MLLIDFDTPIPSSPHLSLLSSDSEKRKVLKIETELAELKGCANCELSIFSNKTDSLTVSVNIVFHQNELLVKIR